MARRTKLVCLVVLVGVAAVFFSPFANLAPSALRAAQAALLLFSLLVAAAFAVALVSLPDRQLPAPSGVPGARGARFHLFDLHCTRIC